MWYSNQGIKLPTPNFKPVTGRFEPDMQKARALGIRYKKWDEVKPNWWANPGLTCPIGKYIFGEPQQVYQKMKEAYTRGDTREVLRIEERAVKMTRERIKAAFGNGSVVFDTNGSTVISLLAKSLVFEYASLPNSIATQDDQGRAVASALGFEAPSITSMSINFEQQLGLFDAPYPEVKMATPSRISPNVLMMSIFEDDKTYKTDGRIIEEYRQMLKKNKNLKMALLLHVSRTGRIMPVDEMVRATRELRDDVFVIIDGCQAVGRVTFNEARHAFEISDGYVIAGHKALGSLVCGAAILQPYLLPHIAKAIWEGRYYAYKLFQFESEALNELVLRQMKAEKQVNYMVSAPEIASMGVSIEDNRLNFEQNRKGVLAQRQEIVQLLSQYDFVRLNVHSCPIVPDIVAFHTEPAEITVKIKQGLQDLTPPITIGPLTDNLAARIGIDPRMENREPRMEYLLRELGEMFERYAPSKA